MPEGAEAAVLHDFGDLLEQLNIPGLALSLGDSFESLQRSPQPFAAGRAFAARFLCQEGDEVPGDVHHAGLIVHDDHAARTHHGSRFGQAVEIDRHVEVRFGQTAAGGAARLHGLEFAAARNAAADVEDDLAQRDSHRDFDQAGVVDFSHHRENLGPAASVPWVVRNIAGAHRAEPLRSAVDDQRNVGPGLDVVEVGRAVFVAVLDGVDVFGSGFAHIPFEGSHQSRGFAAYKGSGALDDLDVEIHSAAENILPEKPVIPRLFDCFQKALAGDGVLVPDVHKALFASDGARADDHSLEHGMRIAFDDAAIHESARISFVGVADQNGIHLAVLRRVTAGFPFHAGREAAAAASPQPGSLDFGDDLLRSHLEESLFQRRVAVDRDVVVDLFRIDDAAVAEDYQLLLGEEGNFLQRRDRALFRLEACTSAS